jgi:hypothetical protein
MATALATVAVVLAVLALVAGLLALRTLGRLRRSVGLLGRGPDGRRESFVETTTRFITLTEQTRSEFEQLNLSMLAALERYDTAARARSGEAEGIVAEAAAGVRAETAAQIEASRADMTAALDQIRTVVERELAQLRDALDADRTAAFADIANDRQRAAGADAAAKERLGATLERIDRVIDAALRRVALVRFDAFDDLSGRLSFSLALLDGRGDGITLTSLAGHSDTRLYAKPINAGAAATDLSPEEQDAVAAALAE